MIGNAPDEEHVNPHGECAHEIATLRARIKALESAQGARVQEPTDAMIHAVKRFARIDSHGEFIPMRSVRDVCRAVLAASPPAPSAPSREPMTDQGAIKRAIESAIHFAEGADGGEDRDGNTIFTDDLLAELYAALTEVSRIGVVVTDEMVERAAQAAYESQTFATDLPWAEVKTDRWHRAARAALHSALGQEKG